MVTGCEMKTYGAPPPVGVAVILIPGFVPSSGAETPVMMPVPCTVCTVAIVG